MIERRKKREGCNGVEKDDFNLDLGLQGFWFGEGAV